MRLSIITLTTDASHFVFTALGSVEPVDGLSVEHIIVHDGGDAFVGALSHRYPHLKIIRGEGAGATAAAVRGVRASIGDFILFLHSDDRLASGALSRFAEMEAKTPEVLIWTGGVRIFADLPEGGEVTIRQVQSGDATALTIENVCDDLPLFSARFCHRSVYDRIGELNPEFSESSDREFLIRAALAGVKEAPLGVLVSEMRLHDGSRTIHGRRAGLPPYLPEHIRIAELWLARPEFRGHARRFLQRWRAREELRLIRAYARAGEWAEIRKLLSRSKVLNPVWYIRLSTAFLARRRRRRGATPEGRTFQKRRSDSRDA